MVKHRSYAIGLKVLGGLFALAVTALLITGPFPQDSGYHAFADARAFLGLQNALNVVSNLGFMAVGILGLTIVLGPAGRRLFEQGWEKRPYAVFFAALIMVGLGSGYYHAEPSTEALFWDRLPMTVAFMSLFSAVIADRIDASAGAIWGLPVLILLGILSLAYWNSTENLGQGDLRAYALVQFFPLVAIPVILWLFPQGRNTHGHSLAWMVAWYGLAKVFEHFDAWIFDHSAHLVSGHSLKHLTSAIAAYMVCRMLAKSAKPRSWFYPPS